MDQSVLQVLRGDKAIQVSIDDKDIAYLALALFVGIFFSLVAAHMVKKII
jgi:hypothetical protein